MRRLVGGFVCVLLLGGAAVSTAQEPVPCRWATESAGVKNMVLNGVAAPAPTNVFAVGTGYSRGQWRTLVRHWDGDSWKTQPSPNVNDQVHALNDVAVAADGTAWAVGERGQSKVKTVVQRYDGTTWRMQRSPNPSKDRNVLYGVDVAPSGDVYAAGTRWNAKRQFRTMIQHYDGDAWEMLAGGYSGTLWAVDVVADDDIWAVGTKTVRGARRTLAIHFDGTRWSEVATPSPGKGTSILYDVSAAAPDDVWAVGDWYDRGTPRAWVVHFDGTSWSRAEIPDLTTEVGLRGVSALDADTAVAVGEDFDAAGDNRAVIEWDGSSWTRAEQDDDGMSTWLHAVDLAPDGEGWAVGYHSGDPESEEYVERRTCG